MTYPFAKASALALALNSLLALMPASGQAPPAAAIERRAYDSWSTSCRVAQDPKAPKICSGELQMIQEKDGQKTVLLQWVFGVQNGKLMSVLSVPTGILLGPGLDLKIGATRQIKIPLSQCDPTHCEAVLPADEALYKDLTLVPQSEITLNLIDGRSMKYAVNMKGLDKTLDEIRRNSLPTKTR